MQQQVPAKYTLVAVISCVFVFTWFIFKRYRQRCLPISPKYGKLWASEQSREFTIPASDTKNSTIDAGKKCSADEHAQDELKRSAMDKQLEEERAAKEAEEKRLEEENKAKERLETERIAREAKEQQLEAERIAREAEAKQLEEERAAKEAEDKRLEEENKAKEAEKQRVEEERMAREAEEQRVEQERLKQEAEEMRLEEEERAKERLEAERIAREAEEKRLEEEEKAKEAEKERIAAERMAREEEEQRVEEERRSKKAEELAKENAEGHKSRNLENAKNFNPLSDINLSIKKLDSSEKYLYAIGKKAGLSSNEVDIAVALFKHFDEDNSGGISEEEFHTIIDILLKHKMKPFLIRRYATAAFQKQDADKSGDIEVNEFVLAFAEILKEEKLNISHMQ